MYALDYWVVDERMLGRYSQDFSSPQVAESLNKLLECEEEVIRFDYWTIRRHDKKKTFCV